MSPRWRSGAPASIVLLDFSRDSRDDRNMTNNNELLQMALVGYRQQIAALSAKVTEIEKGLRTPVHTKTRGRRPMALVDVPKAVHVVKKRKMSAAGRARIVAAQKARWAKVKKTAKAAA